MLGEVHGRIREYVSVSRSTLTMTVGASCVELGRHEKRVDSFALSIVNDRLDVHSSIQELDPNPASAPVRYE